MPALSSFILSVLPLYASFYASTAAAQEKSALELETTQAPPNTCATQVKLYCADESKPSDVVKCLLKNISSLSGECRQELQRFVRAAEQADDQAGGALSGPSALNSLTPPFPVITVEGRHSPGPTSMSEERLNISAPAYQTKTDYLAFSLANGQVHFGDSVQLAPDTLVPQDIYRAEVGSQFNRQLSGHKTWGLRSSIGYAGDRLFQNLNDTAFSVTAQYGYPTTSGGFWMWTLHVSNNSPFGSYIPIPGILYIRKTPTFTGIFGVPAMSFQWTPGKRQAYSLSALGLALTSEAAYGDIRSLQYFTSMKWTNQSFILSKRKEEQDRLTVEEKKAAIGVRSFVFDRMQVEGQAGYAFDRLLYVGDGLRNMQQGSSKLTAEGFVSISLKAGF